MRQRLIAYGEALAGIAIVTLAGRVLFSYWSFAEQVDITTVALGYLLAVLFTASRHGLGPSIFASIIGTISFDFFFFPPIYVLQPKDPHDWIVLTAFLGTSILANRLWATSRAREREAQWHREQVLKLYRLSCAIIINLDPAGLVKSIAREVLEAFGYHDCFVYKKDEGSQWRCVSLARSPAARDSFYPELQLIEDVYQSRDPIKIEMPSAGATHSGIKRNGGKNAAPRVIAAYFPSKAGSEVVAVLVVVAEEAQIQSTEAIASLVALALERARLLNETRTKDALKQSDELKSALLASVSHNLRTPLTSIRASVESILAAEADGGTPTMREFHLIISEEVNRLTKIVDHLLEMARLEAGELRLRREWTSVPELLDNASQTCATSVRAHKLLIECSEEMPLIKVDPRMMTEVLTNLVENAAKYSPTGSEIAINAGVEGQTLRISVADEGPGVIPSEVERIFDKFYRGTQPSQQKQDGTGMGLVIARGIVEAHAGKIWVENRPGSGARFMFTVPVEQIAPSRANLE